tara:strand:- start:3873 stop:4250 length:378 start_codon:yes stop_codon:yes gene_type:complete
MSRKRSFNVEIFLTSEFLRYSRKYDKDFRNYDLLTLKEVIDVEAIQEFVGKDIQSHSPYDSSMIRRKHKKRLSHLTRIFVHEISKRDSNDKAAEIDVIFEVHIALKTMACSVYPCVKTQGGRIYE